jgi:hypothetical protein
MFVEDLLANAPVLVTAADIVLLERLGDDVVQRLVAHLDDQRPLPRGTQIVLENHAVNAFEATRVYGPKTVHDALDAVLNQITGRSFEVVSSGATPEVRQRNLQAWRNWCVRAYPPRAKLCLEH